MQKSEFERRHRPVARACVNIFFFLLLFSFPSVAQNIQWSAPIGDDNQMKFLKIIGSDENNFFLLRSNFPFGTGSTKKSSKSRRYKLACYSQNMVLRWDKTLTAPSVDGKILDVQMVNGRLLVSAYVALKNQTLVLYLQYLDASGNYSGIPVKADEINAMKADDDTRPDLLVSKDELLVALVYRTIGNDENRQSFRALVCDSALAPLFQKEIAMNTGKFLFSVLDIALSDSGNIYLLGKQLTTDKKKAPAESFYTLFAFLRKEDSVVSREIKSDDRVLTDAGLAVDNINNAAVVSGFYSDKATLSTMGVFYFAFKGSSPEESELKTSPFGENFMKKFVSVKKEGDKELVNYSIDRMLLRRDGGAVLAAESYSTFNTSYYDYYTQMLISHTTYIYGNILTLSVNPDGSLLWSDLLSKEHKSSDDDGYFSSYCSAVSGSKMYYIYNKFIASKTSVMLTSVSSKGEQKTMVLFNQLENVTAVPKAARQIEQDVLLLPAYKENQLCIARINF